jgi:acyl-ACP thioesterase
VRAHAFTDLVPLPQRGRVFTRAVRAGLADCAPSGRVRLDALARWLQDVAYDDVEDAGVAGAAVWVVRRTRIRVARFPRFGERFTLKTFCSGFGRAWAERRTTIAAQDGDARGLGRRVPPDDINFQRRGDAAVEAVALWVHLDPASRRPGPLTAEEVEVYGEAAAGRKVTARLRHESPDGAAPARPWAFRATDCDVAGHVNNAAYWQPLEEELLGGEEPDGIDVEMEFRNPAQPGEKLVLGDGERRWIVDGDGDVHASVVLTRVSA